MLLHHLFTLAHAIDTLNNITNLQIMHQLNTHHVFHSSWRIWDQTNSFVDSILPKCNSDQCRADCPMFGSKWFWSNLTHPKISKKIIECFPHNYKQLSWRKVSLEINTKISTGVTKSKINIELTDLGSDLSNFDITNHVLKFWKKNT